MSRSWAQPRHTPRQKLLDSVSSRANSVAVPGRDPKPGRLMATVDALQLDHQT